MPITHLPDDIHPYQTVICTLCGLAIPLDKATAGLLNADNQQTFACNAHFWESSKFILGWIDFAAAERLKMMYLDADPSTLTSSGGDYDARLIS